MNSSSTNGNQIGDTGLHICQHQACTCERSARTKQFLQLLNHLKIASSAIDYEEQISATVATICADETLIPFLRLFLPNEFDERIHTVDTIAQQYLKQASKSVQHLIPLRSLADGNCLFNSVVSLVPDSGVSAVELRVRTIIELVKNRSYYDNQFSNLVGPFNEVIRRTCNNYSFSELYEVVALGNVLRCEVQSVYPYIDYRGEMKKMNAVYKPLDTSVPNNGRIIIFWTNSEDEVSSKSRPGSGGVWSPNHFVPLIRQCRSRRAASKELPCETPESPRKTTIKNNQVASVRSPEFSPPPNARKHKTSFSSIEESLSNLETNDARRKRQERIIENEQQRKERLTTDRLRKRSAREDESEDQQQLRLATDRLAKRTAKENESEDQQQIRLAANRLSQRNVRENENEDQQQLRLANDRLAKHIAKENENEDQQQIRVAANRLSQRNARESESENQRRLRLSDQQKRSARKTLCRSEQRGRLLTSGQCQSDAITLVDRQGSRMKSTEVINLQRQQQLLEKEQQALLNQYVWPTSIPTQLKNHCLQDFSNHMSMSVLRQSTCIVCNSRTFANTMKVHALQDIPNVDKLSSDTDLLNIISKAQQVTQEDINKYSNIFSLSNAVFYKKGYNTAMKTGNICQQCYSALSKDKIPMFSVANKMWIGDVPLELQQLTIAEEKLISLYRHNSCVIKLQSPFHHHSTAQAALKGNVITFMHNMPNIVTSLPLDVEDLSDTLKIVFIGAHTPDRVQLRKICGVRRQKIRNALIWLKTHNHMYRMIPINEVNITKLPEDDVPESIWTTLERIENTIDGNAERTGFTADPLTHATAHGESNVTNVCPMSTSAILDVNGTTISSEDIGVHLLHKVNNSSSNLSSDSPDKSAEDVDDVYMIPRSHMPINDCFNPELLLGLYPTLFPYGCGAPQDSSRPISVSLEQHIRYLLAYDDQRFEKHHSFLFVLFNIMQRRQACWNATLMASRSYFQDAASDLQTLTSKEIEAALVSVTKKTFSSVTNPRVNMLMRQIKTVGGNVMGSAYSRAALRIQIHGLIFNQGLPSIFMTINPADIHNRVALYFAGVDLDLDTIIPEMIPSTYERAQIIASHPVPTARFFNVLISSILKCMVEKGVLGPIKAYFGTVENQGRGSLHLHILMWLDHDLTPSQLKESVQNEEFRKGLLNYLEDIIKQDLSNFDLDVSRTNGGEQQQPVDPVSNDVLADKSIESKKRDRLINK